MEHKSLMRNIPGEERPYEKCWRLGAEALSDAELLAVILRCGSKEENVVDLARRILYRSGHDGLLGLCHISQEELTAIPGIGRVKALQVKCIAEFSRRFARARVQSTLSFHDPSSVADYYMEDLRHEEREKVMLLMLDTRGRLLAEEVISVGTVNASLITPREIFLTALSRRAVSIVLLHNHPSGDPSPSSEDIVLTNRVSESGKILGITLLDHIIIGDGRAVSLRESGLL